MTLERYDAALDEWAAAEARAADEADMAGDERTKSLALMKKSMYQAMLRTLGHENPVALNECAAEQDRRAEIFLSRGDYDGADRCRVKREAILRARALLFEEGEKN